MQQNIKFGIIGYGSRIRNMVNVMREHDQNIQISCITDIRSREEIEKELLSNNYDIENLRYYTDADKMLENEELDGVLIGTRCSLHTPMAVKVMHKDLPLFLEKPVSTSMEQLHSLKKAAEKTKSPVVVSFPLRLSPLLDIVKEVITSGKIGTIEHIQAVNNVPYGGVYYHSWYRDEDETGGLFLQKATHDFDYINSFIGMKPVRICAMKSKQIFKGDKPAGLKCIECDIRKECPESWAEREGEKRFSYKCAFAVDTGNEDSGSALIEYESGMHVAYSQNFFVRRQISNKRGARIMGYKGTVEFDWRTGEVVVKHHHSPVVENYNYDSNDGHGNGDGILARNFVNVVKGVEETKAPLESGILSALMCLKARESANTHTFQEIKF